MFNLTDVQQLPVNSLRHYKNHPFKLYTGKRLDDLVESIRSNGILSPIIAHSISEGEYEILSGHNRVEAAKLAGLETVPAIIRDDLTNEQADFIVTETNLIQRSFADLTHSERANALAAHYEAVKRQGKRTDLLQSLEEFIGENTSRQTGEKLSAGDETGKQYGLSSRNVQRYVRLSKLIKPLQERLDNGELPYLAGVELAYISPERQKWIDEALNDESLSIDVVKTARLREKLKDDNDDITEDSVKDLIFGNDVPLPDKSQAIRIGTKLLNKYDYFKTYHTPEEVEETIDKALAKYFSEE